MKEDFNNEISNKIEGEQNQNEDEENKNKEGDNNKKTRKN